jgi:hypothetical protein
MTKIFTVNWKTKPWYFCFIQSTMKKYTIHYLNWEKLILFLFLNDFVYQSQDRYKYDKRKWKSASAVRASTKSTSASTVVIASFTHWMSMTCKRRSSIRQRVCTAAERNNIDDSTECQFSYLFNIDYIFFTMVRATEGFGWQRPA